jgi:hypothetical protein
MTFRLSSAPAVSVRPGRQRDWFMNSGSRRHVGPCAELRAWAGATARDERPSRSNGAGRPLIVNTAPRTSGRTGRRFLKASSSP